MSITVQLKGTIGILSIAGNGPRNMFTAEIINSLDTALQTLDANPEIEVMILRGEGSGSFSAGMDPAAMSAMLEGMDEISDVARHYVYPQVQQPTSPWAAWHTLLHRRTVKPVVAAVRGECLGVALMILALHTDVRIASEDACFGFPDIRRGFGSGQAIASRLTEQIPKAAVHWLVQTGRPIDAKEALRVCLINEIRPDAEVDRRAMELAAKITARPSLALRSEKLAAIHLERADYRDAVALGAALHTLSQMIA